MNQIAKNNADDVIICMSRLHHKGEKLKRSCYLSLDRLKDKKMILIDIKIILGITITTLLSFLLLCHKMFLENWKMK